MTSANVPALANVTVLPKLFPALFTVMLAPLAAVNDAAPVIASAPLLVMLPAVAVASKVPVTVDAPKFKPFASTIVTLTPVVETAPVKLFPALLRVTSKPAADAVVVPPIVRGPLLVMSPPAVMLRLPEKFDVPISNADTSTTVTFAIPLAPLNATDAPKLLLGSLSVMLAPTPSAVNVARPPMTRAPVLVMSPVVAVTLKLFATVEAPRTKPFTSLIMTSLPLTIDTAPTKLLLLLNVTVLSGPAVTVVNPPMFIMPGTLTAPLAVIVKSPPWVVMAFNNVTVDPASNTTFRSFPAVAVMSALKLMLPTASSVSVADPPPLMVTPVVIVMLPACAWPLAVKIMTSVPALRLELIVPASTVAPFAVGVKVSGFPPPNAPPAVAVVIKTFDGSKSHVPACPSADDASTRPNA